MKKLKKIGIVMGLLLSCAAAWLIYLYVIAGELRSIEPHFAGRCTQVKGVVGAEDITLQPGGRLAYISSDDRRATIAGEPRTGAIFGYFLDGPGKGRLVNLTPKPPRNFHPHGIGLLARAGKPDRLFVVSHPGASLFSEVKRDGPAHTIEVFELRGRTLAHLRTVSDPGLLSPNDVAPVGPDSFYATNDHGSAGLWGQKAEDYLRLARAQVVFHDGASLRVVDRGLRYANGIALSRDLRQVHVAATTDREVVTYDRSPDGGLTRRGAVFLDTGVDNIELDAAGNLWIGAHPRLLTFVAHAGDASKPSPSQVLKLSPDGKGGFRSEEVMMSAGADLSGSSVAAPLGKRLLVGGVFDARFLDCQMN